MTTPPDRILLRGASAPVLTFDEWVSVLDALEPDATTAQRDAAQDAIQRRAPRTWLETVEDRDSR